MILATLDVTPVATQVCPVQLGRFRFRTNRGPTCAPSALSSFKRLAVDSAATEVACDEMPGAGNAR